MPPKRKRRPALKKRKISRRSRKSLAKIKKLTRGPIRKSHKPRKAVSHPQGKRSRVKKASFVNEDQLPSVYQTTSLWLMVKDPTWLFATWEIAPKDLKNLKTKMKGKARGAVMVLRIYDVTWVEFNGANANSHFDIEVGLANNWHINLRQDNVSCCGEIGLKTKQGGFFPLIRSNFVETPPAGFSQRTEQIWMTVPASRREINEEGASHPFALSRRALPPRPGESKPFRQTLKKKTGKKQLYALFRGPWQKNFIGASDILVPRNINS